MTSTDMRSENRRRTARRSPEVILIGRIPATDKGSPRHTYRGCAKALISQHTGEILWEAGDESQPQPRGEWIRVTGYGELYPGTPGFDEECIHLRPGDLVQIVRRGR